MSVQDKLTIGLFGFGVVGEGIYKVMNQTPSLHAEIKKIVIRHPEKERNASPQLFTTDKNEVLNDTEINLVVELIDDADEAYRIVTTALKSRKAVVSANKKMIAEHLEELIALQKEFDVPFLYEAAVCGSIPIIRNLEEYYDNDLLQSVCGIVNGSTNFILTKISQGLSYQAALHEAQRLGFAESNPALDVEGKDAVNKLSILLAHAYGIISHPADLVHSGITRLHLEDGVYAQEKGYRIKLTAQARKLDDGRVAAFVLPQFVKDESQLFHVKDEYNGVVIESRMADKQFLYGKGAGRFPTSSAVVSDISAARYGYRYEYKKLNREEDFSLTYDYYLQVYVSFNDWVEVSKWDFEEVTTFHSTRHRQYLTGVIHINKLKNASWFHDPAVSVILIPGSIITREERLQQSIKQVSLQLAGVN